MTDRNGRGSIPGVSGEDEGDLAPFFAAARASRPEPDARLLEAVLADAAAETQPAPRWRWPAAAALAASVAAGFLIGITGIAPLDGGLALSADGTFEIVSALDSDAAGFFDLGWEG